MEGAVFQLRSTLNSRCCCAADDDDANGVESTATRSAGRFNLAS
jgi:hypothetical protein